MSVVYIPEGKRADGFVGFKVTGFDGEHHQNRYFTTLPAKQQDDSDVYYRYQKLKAEQQDAAWAVDELEKKYLKFISTSRGNTKPERGVGVHGIVAMYVPWGDRWEPGFSVSRADQGPKRFLFKHYRFSEAWHEAVNLWAQEYGIVDEDREWVLQRMPEPEQFKRLRHQMNDHEGHDIPVEALRPVFREQREHLALTRLSEKAQQLKLNERESLQVPTRNTENEMLAWFERERAM